LPVPRRISLGGSQVTIDWSDGHGGVYSNKRLREACPCAVCVGEPPALGVSTVIPLMVAAPEGVFAERYSLIGRYAVAFAWSDRHSSGIYAYDYLLSMCECGVCTARAAARKVGQGGLIPEGRR